MNLTESLEFEESREKDKDSWNKILLSKNGTFYHAYEWSAWIIKMFVCTEKIQKERKDDKILAVTKSSNKNQEYVMVGFPLDSLKKFVLNCEIIKTSDSGDMILMTKAFDSGNKTFEELKKKFDEWKESIPRSESKKSVKEITSKRATEENPGLLQISIEILDWPLDQRSPAENTEFIRKLKKQILSHL